MHLNLIIDKQDISSTVIPFTDYLHKPEKKILCLLKSIQYPEKTELDLSNNFLGDSIDLLSIVCKNLPYDLQSLKLSNNNLGSISNWQLSHLSFSAQRLSSLNLSQNFLIELGVNKLLTLFALLPNSLEKLDLSSNYLGEFNEFELSIVLKAIPSNIRSVDISYNWFYLSEEQKSKIIGLFNDSIECIIFDGTDYNRKNFPKFDLSSTSNISLTHFDGPRPNLPSQEPSSLGLGPTSDTTLAPIVGPRPKLRQESIQDKQRLIQEIDKQLERLKHSLSSSWNIFVLLHLISPSDDKYSALLNLKNIFNSSPDENLREQVQMWKNQNNSIVKTQRNFIHSFFSPSHKPTLEVFMEDVYNKLS